MLATLSTIAKRHSLPSFFVLAYALSWWLRLWYSDPLPFYILDWGPLLAALIVLGLTGGRDALKSFLGQIIQWRVGVRWYILVLGLPALIGAGGAGLNLLLGATIAATIQWPTWLELIVGFIFLCLWTGLGEEPAWRGYALPRLLVGHSPLTASVLLGLCHVLWHLSQFGVDIHRQYAVP